MIRIRIMEPHRDAAQIAEIYSWYVANTTATFETVPPSPEAMGERLHAIATAFPAFVCDEIEEDGHVGESEGDGTTANFSEPGGERGEGRRLLGYCYAHLWKTFAAYSRTLETTIYLRPGMQGRGIGKALMEKLVDSCRENGYGSLVACITAENESSRRFHERLGFVQVSDFHDVGHKFGRPLSVTDYQLML